MEQRIAKLITSPAGGTASKGAQTYKIALPTAWVRAMKAADKNAEICLSFDGQTISVRSAEAPEQFVRRCLAQKHTVRKICYYDAGTLCSTIFADFTSRELLVENSAGVSPVKTAFGANTRPTWEQFEAFLRSRCIPRSRAGCREYLAAWGLDEYDPLAIVQKTQGRMAEDAQWLSIEELI